MIIQCPSCAATYDLPDASVNSGRKVRCAVCKTMWVVKPTEAATATMLAAEPLAAEPFAALPPIPASLEDRFEADDLRLAGLSEAANQFAGMEDRSASQSAPALRFSLQIKDDELAPHLKAEATTDEDLTARAETEPDNSQDDVDALFDTPSAAEFGAVEAEDAALSAAVQDKDAAGDAALGANLAAKARRGRARMSEAKAPRRTLPLAAAAAIAIFAALASTLFYRDSVVNAMPQSARLFSALGMPVNLRGVEIRNVESKIIVEQGVQQLVVEGELVNVQKSETKLSRLRFAIRSEKGQEIYSWKATAEKPALELGETLRFRRRLASPPDGAAVVVVRFETRGDMVAGVQ